MRDCRRIHSMASRYPGVTRRFLSGSPFGCNQLKRLADLTSVERLFATVRLHPKWWQKSAINDLMGQCAFRECPLPFAAIPYY
jgi:hypothetical protein